MINNDLFHRWYTGNRCHLEYQGTRCSFLWPIFLPATNLLHRLQVGKPRLFSSTILTTECSSALPPSKNEYPIRGLNLIRLLTQNRIADFHTTLESLPIPADAIADNQYISHPVNLEQWLMEGSYSKVWNARERAPVEEYKFFVDSLMGTIRCVLLSSRSVIYWLCHRNEIASCEEAAYESLPLKDALTLLFFNNQSELLKFAQQVSDDELCTFCLALTLCFRCSGPGRWIYHSPS